MNKDIYFIGGPLKSHFAHVGWIESISANRIDFLVEKPKTFIRFLRPIDIIFYQYLIYRKTHKCYKESSIIILETLFSLPYAYFLKQKYKKIRIISLIPDTTFYPPLLPLRKHFYNLFNLKKTVDYFISVSETIKKWMIKYYNIEEHRIFVVRPFSILKVDKKEIKNKKKRKVITFIKNYPKSNIAKLIVNIAKKLEDFEFNIIGSITKKIKNPPKNVKRYINISWEELKKLLLNSSIYLHPMHFDPFPVSVLDAMRCGNFPLVYRLVGVSEILDKKNVFYSLNEEEITENILNVYENLKRKDFIKYYKLGMKFSEEKSIKEFKKIIDKII